MSLNFERRCHNGVRHSYELNDVILSSRSQLSAMATHTYTHTVYKHVHTYIDMYACLQCTTHLASNAALRIRESRKSLISSSCRSRPLPDQQVARDCQSLENCGFRRRGRLSLTTACITNGLEEPDKLVGDAGHFFRGTLLPR